MLDDLHDFLEDPLVERQVHSNDAQELLQVLEQGSIDNGMLSDALIAARVSEIFGSCAL